MIYVIGSADEERWEFQMILPAQSFLRNQVSSIVYRPSLHFTDYTNGLTWLDFDMSYVGMIFIFFDIYIYLKTGKFSMPKICY